MIFKNLTEQIIPSGLYLFDFVTWFFD